MLDGGIALTIARGTDFAGAHSTYVFGANCGGCSSWSTNTSSRCALASHSTLNFPTNMAPLQ